jgi:protein involved in polysaccharide export with SLBB domain
MMVVSPGYTTLPRNDDHVIAPPRRVRLRNIFASTTAAFALAGLSACSQVPALPPAPPAPPPDTGVVSNLTPYRIQVGDVLGVRLILNPELNEEVTVRPDGHISTTVVKDELAYGRTVQDLSAALVRDYSTELRNPRLTVVVRSFAPTRIYVGGEVTSPGEFITVGPSLTLSQAIARAGGLKTMTGDEGRIFVIRRGPNDVPQLFSTRYQDVMWGKDATSDVRLAPFDVVFVPRSGISEVYRFVNSYLLQFVPVSWGFSYLVGGNGGGGTSVVQSPTTK